MKFVNKLELSDEKYQTNRNVRYENCKVDLLFTMKDFVSIGTDHQPMYFISTRLSKDNIDGVHVKKF